MPSDFKLPVWEFNVSRDQQHLTATDDSGALWISNDGAVSWTKSSLSFGWATTWISDDNILWVANDTNNGKLYRSTDWGATMVPVLTPAAGFGVASVAAGNNNTTVVATLMDFVGSIGTSTVTVSNNNGGTWTAVPTSTIAAGTWGFYFDVSSNGQHIIAANGTHVYISDDAGATWNSPTITGLTGRVQGVAMSPEGGVIAVAEQNKHVYKLDRRPTSPTGVSVTSRSATSISLTWTDAESYSPITDHRIQVFQTAGGISKVVATHAVAAGTSTTITGLQPNTSYWIWVQAVSALGVSAEVDHINGVTDSAAPSKPVFVSPNLLAGKAAIKWSSVANGAVISKYEYCTALCTKAASWKRTAASKPWVNLTGLKKGTKYTVKVRATNARGVSAVATQTFTSK